MKKVPIIKGDDILTETEFYNWLKFREGEGIKDTNFIPTIKEYTNNIEAPFKGRKDGKAHQYVFDCFCREINDKKDKLRFANRGVFHVPSKD